MDTGRPFATQKLGKLRAVCCISIIFSRVLMLVDAEVFVEPNIGLVMPLLEQQGMGVAECRVTEGLHCQALILSLHRSFSHP